MRYVLLACWLVTLAGACAFGDSPAFQARRLLFQSDGHTIDMDTVTSGGSGRRPAVILLHGSGGMAGNSGWMRSYGVELARRGFAVFVPYYFQSTDTESADIIGMFVHFPTWLQVVHDAIGEAAHDARVDPHRIGVLGLSLGAYLGLSESTRDPRVKAMVEFFGGLPQPFQSGAEHMPPLLILHGDRDNTVPVAEARRLKRLMIKYHRPFDIRIYHGQGHGFQGEAENDARRRTMRFFERHLR